MANIKISELTEKTTLHKDDLFPIVDSEADLTKSVKFGTIKPYKIYTFLATQTSTNAPTVTVLENTLGGTVVWTYDSAGVYVGTLAGAFTVNKTVIPQHGTSNNEAGADYYLNVGRTDDNSIYVETALTSTSVSTDGLLTAKLIEIRVYN